MKIHGKQWLPFLGIQTEKKIIKNDALPHKPNCVEHVLSGDSTFFHAADYFSYLTNEKMLLQSSLLFIFFIWHRRRLRCSGCCRIQSLHIAWNINYVRIIFRGIEKRDGNHRFILLLLRLLLLLLSYCY